MGQGEDAMLKVARDMVEVMLAELSLMYELSGREVMRYTALLRSLAMAAVDQIADADLRAFVAERQPLFRPAVTTRNREEMQTLIQDPEYIKSMAEAIRRVAELGPDEPQQ